MLNNRQKIVLASKQIVANNTLELTYESEDTLAFVAGQFYSFHITVDGVEKSRSYSAANPIVDPRSNHTLTIVVTLHEQGFASQYFTNGNIGDSVEVSGPYGNLILPPQAPERIVMFATGTGVAPYRSMVPKLEQLLSEGDTSVILAMGVRTAEDLFYADTFLDLAERYEGFDFRAFYSQQSPGRAFEYAGRVTEMFEQETFESGRDLIFVCGNPDMVNDVVTSFTALDFTPREVKREKYTLSPF